MAAQDHPNGLRVGRSYRRNVQAELEPGPAPGDPEHALAETVLGEGFAICRSGKGNACVGVEMVHVGGVHESMHGRVDRGRRPTFTMEAEVERSHHLVFALLSGVNIDERSQAVQA
jgi:hypothetical protein